MNRENTSVSITIDNKKYTTPRGTTILEVAQEHEVYIPTLCYHKDLSPHGGCRLCIVEVEGVRNFPTACTTPVEDGMVVRTRTAQVQAMRLDILQLFLSEHTSSCLLCDEKVECKEFMSTIRKAGVTTGCRYCPKDTQCELQTVAEYLEVKDINYPIYYRSMRVETEDPFYDRDYNLCILCGRCVRVCQEIRTANVLAYKYRGRNTTVGPAFHRTHLEAGCEFCGACVAVCPTGSLREKARQWEGKPDREEITTCSFCGVGCQLKLLVKGSRVIGSLPAEDQLVNNSQLCVKGRFCNTELVNGYRRLRNPYKKFVNISTEISWDDAIDIAVEKLSSCAPEEFALLVSPNCCTEDLYVAQKFARLVMGSHHVDTSARTFHGNGFNEYVNLLRRGSTLADVRQASAVITIGLDTRFGRSVVGVALRQAVKNGAKIIAVNPRHHNFSLISDIWLECAAGEEAELLQDLARLVGGGKAATSRPASKRFASQLAVIAKIITQSPRTVILTGSDFLQYTNSRDLLAAVAQLAEAAGASVMPLPAHNNLFGSLLAGAYPELIPGAGPISDRKQAQRLEKIWGKPLPEAPPRWDASLLWAGQRTKVLYLIGELPPNDHPPADFLIFQNIYPPEPYCQADLVLPSAASTEINGTFVNGEGRIQRVRKAVEPLGNAIPDWQILSRIAKKMGADGFEYGSVEEIREEMAKVIDAYRHFDRLDRPASSLVGAGQLRSPAENALIPAVKPPGQSSFVLTITAVEHTHRGFPLASWVEGFKMLLTEGMVEINPDDARAFGIAPGDEVIVTLNGAERTWPAKIVREQRQGTLHASLRECVSIRPNPQTVTIRKANV